MMDNVEPRFRKLVMVGLVVGAVVLAAVVLFALVSRGKAVAVPSSTMPDVASLPFRNVSSSDHKNMVRVRGYVFQYDVGFIPIDVNNVTLDEKASQVTMASEHVALRATYKMDKGTTNIRALELLFPDATAKGKSGTTWTKICEILPYLNFSYDSKDRFSCESREIRTCFDQKDAKQGKRVAELLLESIDIELGGDPAKISQGQFSKDSKADGCTLKVSHETQADPATPASTAPVQSKVVRLSEK